MAAGVDWLYTVVPELDGLQASDRSTRVATCGGSQHFRVRQVFATCCLGVAASLACFLTFTSGRWGASSLQREKRPVDFDSVIVLDVQDIVANTDFASGCPYFAVGLTEEECRAMPEQFGGKLHDPFLVETAEDPRGCFSFSEWYYYNQHEIGGSRRSGRKVYCKRSNVSARFQIITRGVCVDYGYLPINSQITCEDAAREMGLANPEVKITTLSGRPEGCYYFKNFLDGTATLWISTNAENQGRGEQESDTPGEFIRQPVCMAQTTTMPAAIPMEWTTLPAQLETTDTMTTVITTTMITTTMITTTVTTTTVTTTSAVPRVSQTLDLAPTKATAMNKVTAVAQCKYVTSNGFVNACPSGAVSLNETECRSMPNRFGGALNNPFIIESGEDPRGCFKFFKWYYYNIHPNGKGRIGREMYCKHC